MWPEITSSTPSVASRVPTEVLNLILNFALASFASAGSSILSSTFSTALQQQAFRMSFSKVSRNWYRASLYLTPEYVVENARKARALMMEAVRRKRDSGCSSAGEIRVIRFRSWCEPELAGVLAQLMAVCPSLVEMMLEVADYPQARETKLICPPLVVLNRVVLEVDVIRDNMLVNLLSDIALAPNLKLLSLKLSRFPPTLPSFQKFPASLVNLDIFVSALVGPFDMVVDFISSTILASKSTLLHYHLRQLLAKKITASVQARYTSALLEVAPNLLSFRNNFPSTNDSVAQIFRHLKSAEEIIYDISNRSLSYENLKPIFHVCESVSLWKVSVAVVEHAPVNDWFWDSLRNLVTILENVVRLELPYFIDTSSALLLACEERPGKRCVVAKWDPYR